MNFSFNEHCFTDIKIGANSIDLPIFYQKVLRAACGSFLLRLELRDYKTVDLW